MTPGSPPGLTTAFAQLTFDEARAALASQPGQWDVVNHPGDLLNDPQAKANGFVQEVDYGDGRTLPMVASPVQFDRTPPQLSPAPAFSADADEVLGEIGMDEQAILDAKISGALI